MGFTIHPDDPMHVALDALAFMASEIENNPNYCPWDDYWGDDDDPKRSKDGYLAVIANATTLLEARLSRSEPL